jgi:peptide/nickel transport system substrate-binding protein
VQLQWVENWGQILATNQPRGIRDWSATSFFNDPVSFIPGNFGRRGSMTQNGEWANDEAAGLIELMTTSTDWDERLRAWRRVLEIVERDDPAITILHQTANFTGKRRDIRWRPARSFVMDFQARNFRMGAG